MVTSTENNIAAKGSTTNMANIIKIVIPKAFIKILKLFIDNLKKKESPKGLLQFN